MRENRAPQGTSSVGFIFGVCGSDVLPGPILVELLGHLGFTTAGARQLLNRLRRMGWLAGSREGRISLIRLAGELETRYRTIQTGEPTQPSWTGAFWTVVYDLPENRRQERDRLRNAAFEAGYAALRPGVLIGFKPPSSWLEDCAAATDGSLIESGTLAMPIEAARRVASLAWQLDAGRQRVNDAADTIRAWADMEIHDDWTPLRMLHDAFALASPLWIELPNVPEELLVDDLGLGRLGAEVGALSARLQPRVVETITRYLAQHPHAGLVQRATPEPQQ